ncbi:MAG TPA: BACON domain-containing carbohydrate-binding protein [Kiritimatiellia bacterium]|nr:BACON domain-containing carbohydrate-binding protein [Kiritimatiellia bacterium]HMO97563.1 BACON domain-containing carbohydrate-binding protein [Kiritimatiellia bacterium]HMP95951.1 BACON domain-containing carbohydrate-binding protein [Kiritimatiellia bacterium]
MKIRPSILLATVLAASTTMMTDGLARNLQISPTLRYPGTSPSSATLYVTSDVPWRAWANDSWISVTGDYPEGLTNGSVAYSILANAGNPGRTGTITVAGGGITRTLTLIQSAAATNDWLYLDPNQPHERRHDVGGGGNYSIFIQGNADWTVSKSDGWFAVTNVISGTGARVLRYMVGSNGGAGRPPREGYFLISGGGTSRLFRISQDSDVSGVRNLSIVSNEYNVSGPTRVTNWVQSNVGWQIVPNHAWITVIGSTFRSNNQEVVLNVAANRGNASRVGTVTIRGPAGLHDTYRIIQAPNAYAYFSVNRHDLIPNQQADVSITIFANKSWSFGWTNDWIYRAEPHGTGNVTTSYGVESNPGGVTRHGRLELRTPDGDYDVLHVYQSGGIIALNPTNRNHGADALTGQTFAVTANLNWRAIVAPAESWIHLTGITNHSGNGTVTYRIDANAGDDRTGTISVFGADMGRLFTINQAGSGVPRVWLRPASAGLAHIAWPTSHTGYVVQQRPSMMTGSWVNQAGSPVVVGDEHQHTIAPVNDAHFYRLHKP